MVTDWDPARYEDRFSDAIHALAAQKVEAGETAQVKPLEEADAVPGTSNVVDLSELLKRSLDSRKPGAKTTPKDTSKATAKPAAKAPAKAPAKTAAKTAAKTTPARKAARKAA
jgi:DNA end-binding protein Ku